MPGRLERIHERPTVLRDYAHTPDALERALTAVRPFAERRLIVVFGCGGDRDRGKRPQMGAIAERLADHAIVTSDNPRTEDPDRIIDDIEAGMHGTNHERITDRHDAIARALTIAAPDDVVVLAGKGHETYQIRGTIAYPFDEREIVRELAFTDSPLTAVTHAVSGTTNFSPSSGATASVLDARSRSRRARVGCRDAAAARLGSALGGQHRHPDRRRGQPVRRAPRRALRRT